MAERGNVKPWRFAMKMSYHLVPNDFHAKMVSPPLARDQPMGSCGWPRTEALCEKPGESCWTVRWST
ncbi:hypothetical protein CM1200mP19_2900 [bacterium]|nr:MAG: hypothetical protein CM1200mP19_2900 [bacterium]